MSHATHYLAISLGPIYATISRARKTRELWTASYLFSRFMQILRDECEEAGGRILSPQEPGSAVNTERFGAGIYPDRLYAMLTDADQKSVDDMINRAVEKLSESVKGKRPPDDRIPDPGRYEADRLSFWKDYFRVATVLAARAEIDAGGNVLANLNGRLDTLELQPVYVEEQPALDELIGLLDNPYRTELAKSGLKYTANGKSAYHEITLGKKEIETGNTNRRIERFPSTAEIGSLELFQRAPDNYRKLQAAAVAGIQEEDGVVDTRLDSSVAIEAFFNELFAGENGAQEYHKYFCIVFADGDNFGKIINGLGNDLEAIEAFSKKLATYTAGAAGIINRYGGKPVYVGGDDLLFFAPVVALEAESGRPKTVFQLLAALDEAFTEMGLGADVSLSYGLTVTYYKFPLFEARDLSYAQLFERAKKMKWGDKAKDSVAFRLLKHSGSYFEGALNKSMLFALNTLSDDILTPQLGGTGAAANLLSSVSYKLRELEELMNSLHAAGRITAKGDALTHLFTNFFNEPIHQHYRPQLKKIEDFVRLCYLTRGEMFDTNVNYCEGVVESSPISTADNVYALLRLLNFMAPQKSKNYAPATGN